MAHKGPPCGGGVVGGVVAQVEMTTKQMSVTAGLKTKHYLNCLVFSIDLYIAFSRSKTLTSSLISSNF